MSTLKGLSQFKSKLIGGGARPNLFEVSIPSPPPGITLGIQGDGDGVYDAEKFQFLCKSAALPASNIAPIDVPFRGRIMKVAGDRTFDTWTITVINDEDFMYRRFFESWMQNIGQYSDHSGLTRPLDYMVDATVVQLGRGTANGGNADFFSGTSPSRESGAGSQRNASVLAQYKFKDIFPTNISQIDLSYDTSDTIEEFTVELQVQFWYPERPGSNSASSDPAA
jgi:hypothetical protein